MVEGKIQIAGLDKGEGKEEKGVTQHVKKATNIFFQVN